MDNHLIVLCAIFIFGMLLASLRQAECDLRLLSSIRLFLTIWPIAMLLKLFGYPTAGLFCMLILTLIVSILIFQSLHQAFAELRSSRGFPMQFWEVVCKATVFFVGVVLAYISLMGRS